MTEKNFHAAHLCLSKPNTKIDLRKDQEREILLEFPKDDSLRPSQSFHEASIDRTISVPLV